MEKNSAIGILGFLGLLFIGLKLTGYINWSWLWVLSPFWFPIGICGIMFIFSLIFAFIIFYIENKGEKS